MSKQQQVAIAVIHFAGTPEVFAFKITGPALESVSPALELERFMGAVDRALDRLDPFGLQIMAANILDSRFTQVEVAMDFDPADIPAILAESELSQLRTV